MFWFQIFNNCKTFTTDNDNRTSENQNKICFWINLKICQKGPNDSILVEILNAWDTFFVRLSRLQKLQTLLNCLSVYLSICLSVYLSICLSVYLSICLSVYLYFCLSKQFLNFIVLSWVKSSKIVLTSQFKLISFLAKKN